ncbi:MAG: hypothetical protein HPY55_11065 [Firmicutes bacterium]|nr:hypothetical protein [Bacillota bacterium]
MAAGFAEVPHDGYAVLNGARQGVAGIKTMAFQRNACSAHRTLEKQRKHNGAKVLDIFLDSHPEVPNDLHVESNTSPEAKDTERILAHWRVLPSASGDNQPATGSPGSGSSTVQGYTPLPIYRNNVVDIIARHW